MAAEEGMLQNVSGIKGRDLTGVLLDVFAIYETGRVKLDQLCLTVTP